MSVGQNIRKVRELKNFTQSYVARRLGITAAAYSRIERDQTNIGLKRLRQIAAALDTDAASILNFSEQEIFGLQTLITEIRLLREALSANR